MEEKDGKATSTGGMGLLPAVFYTVVLVYVHSIIENLRHDRTEVQ